MTARALARMRERRQYDADLVAKDLAAKDCRPHKLPGRFGGRTVRLLPGDYYATAAADEQGQGEGR